MSLNPEGALLREMKDISDELSIMMGVMTQQKTIAIAFVKNVKRLNSAQYSSSTRNQVTSQKFVPLPPGDTAAAIEPDNRPNVAKSNWFTRNSAEDLLAVLEDRKAELQHLQDAAEQTTQSLRALLELKQKYVSLLSRSSVILSCHFRQANVLEAREALKSADGTATQSRSIMLFTIMTIIFVCHQPTFSFFY
jgi:hypothetical protein